MNSGLQSQTFHDPFLTLGELGSLHRLIEEHRTKIVDEEQRIEKLNSARQSKTLELAEKKSLQKNKTIEAKRFELELAQAEENLAKTQANSQLAKDARQVESLEKEIAHLSTTISQKEEHALQLLEESDRLAKEISEIEKYLLHSEAALAEIKNDVLAINQKHSQEIQNLQERFQALLPDLSSEYRQAFLYVLDKFKKGKPLSWLEGQRCDSCRFVLDRQSAIDLSHGIHPFYCPGCGRLLVIRRNS